MRTLDVRGVLPDNYQFTDLAALGRVYIRSREGIKDWPEEILMSPEQYDRYIALLRLDPPPGNPVYFGAFVKRRAS